MSLDATLARIAQLQALTTPPRVTPPQPAVSATSFAGELAGATVGASPAAAGTAPTYSLAAAPVTGGTSAGQAALAFAQRELGVREEPPGSNDSPRITEFRRATAGSPGPGPWCAYFVSWAAREAGAPLGDRGQGFGLVDDVMAWGQSTGRVSQTPQPGDLIVWDEHIGIVESVAPDGGVTTIEGNSSDSVARRTYGADGGGALGYVRLG